MLMTEGESFCHFLLCFAVVVSWWFLKWRLFSALQNLPHIYMHIGIARKRFKSKRRLWHRHPQQWCKVCTSIRLKELSSYHNGHFMYLFCLPGDVLPQVQGMDYTYKPQLGDLPTLNLPEVHFSASYDRCSMDTIQYMLTLEACKVKKIMVLLW